MTKEIDSVEFTKKRELAFLKEQRLGRIATVSSQGQPHVVPVVFELMASVSTLEDGNSRTV